MRVRWGNLMWWWSIGAAFGALLGSDGCGGRLEAAQCRLGWQFCKEAVVCCPDNTACGTGQPNAQGLTCPLGDCCPALDGGDDSGTSEDAWPGAEMDAAYVPPPEWGQPSSPNANFPGYPGGQTGGIKPPQIPPPF